MIKRKKILISGASSGLGKSLALKLLKNNNSIYCIGRSILKNKNIRSIKCNFKNPNNIQKKGVNVTLFSDKKNENEQDMENVEEVEETNEEKEDKEEKEETIQENQIETKPKKRCIIKDGRNKTISRETIMETLKSNKIFSRRSSARVGENGHGLSVTLKNHAFSHSLENVEILTRRV